MLGSEHGDSVSLGKLLRQPIRAGMTPRPQPGKGLTQANCTGGHTGPPGEAGSQGGARGPTAISGAQTQAQMLVAASSMPGPGVTDSEDQGLSQELTAAKAGWGGTRLRHPQAGVAPQTEAASQGPAGPITCHTPPQAQRGRGWAQQRRETASDTPGAFRKHSPGWGHGRGLSGHAGTAR